MVMPARGLAFLRDSGMLGQCVGGEFCRGKAGCVGGVSGSELLLQTSSLSTAKARSTGCEFATGAAPYSATS